MLHSAQNKEQDAPLCFVSPPARLYLWRRREYFQPHLALWWLACQLQNQVSEQMAELQTKLQALFHGPGIATLGKARYLSIIGWNMLLYLESVPVRCTPFMTLPVVERRLVITLARSRIGT